MIYRFLADLVFIFHFCFVIFVIFGGLLAFRWRRIIWLHLPALVWAIAVEFFQLLCPLTTLENHLKHLGGEKGYAGGFIEYYVLRILYVPLSSQTQIALGALLLIFNLVIYYFLIRRWKKLS